MVAQNYEHKQEVILENKVKSKDCVQSANKPRINGFGRFGIFCGKLALVVVTLLLLLCGSVVFLLKTAAPVDYVRDQIILALQKEFGQGAKIGIGSLTMGGDTAGINAEIVDLTVDMLGGKSIVSAPHARVNFTTSGLAKLDLTPKLITLKDTRIALVVDANGQVSISQNANSNEPQSLEDTLKQIFLLIKNSRTENGVQLPKIDIENGQVEINDQRNTKLYSIKNINIGIENNPDNQSSVRVNANGQSGKITARLLSGADPLNFRLVIEQISVADLAALGGVDLKFLSGDLPISAEFITHWSDDAKLKRIDGFVSAGEGQIFIDDPDAKPISIMHAKLGFHYDAGTPKINITEIDFNAGGVALNLAGDAVAAGTLDTKASDDEWNIRLSGKNGILAPLLPVDQPVIIDDTIIVAQANIKNRVLKLQMLELSGTKLSAKLRGEARFDEVGRMSLAADLKVIKSDARSILHIWPSFVAPPLRRFLIDNLISGVIPQMQISTDISADTFNKIKIRQPMPVESVSANFALVDTKLILVPGVPPLSNLSLIGQATGQNALLNTIKANVKLETGQVLAINDGSLTMADLARQPIETKSQFRLVGGLDGVLELLSYPALKGVLPVGAKSDAIKGQFDGQVNVVLPLKKKILPTDVNLQAKATLSSLVAERFFGKENFEAQTIQFLAQTGSISLKGEGKVGGMPARIDLVQPRRGDAEDAVVVLTLDEAARSKRGINLSPQLTGPVTALIKTDFPVDIKSGIPIEIDLTKSAIDGLLPGWVKSAGKPAKLRFILNEKEGGYRLTNLELDGNAPALKGIADLASDGSLTSFQLSSLVLSQGDVMQVDGQKTASGLKLTIRANSFDARPFLRGVAKNNTQNPNKEFEIDLKAVALSGFNGEIASNGEIKLIKRGSQIKQGTFSAKLNGVPVSAKITPRNDGTSVITMNTQNAGAVLRFMDIYNRMQRGTMDMNLTKTGDTEQGYVTVHDFVLRDEPALKRAAQAAAKPQDASDGRAQGSFIADASDVAFTKLRLDFTRKGDYFDVSDAVMWGREVGGTLSGELDYGRDRVNISGTFVPAYGLNNAFAKIPVFGLFLTGNKYEGVFSVPFQISGRASAPSLTINAIAAVSPGFLRKIFDFRGGATGTVPRGGE